MASALRLLRSPNHFLLWSPLRQLWEVAGLEPGLVSGPIYITISLMVTPAQGKAPS